VSKLHTQFSYHPSLHADNDLLKSDCG